MYNDTIMLYIDRLYMYSWCGYVIIGSQILWRQMQWHDQMQLFRSKMASCHYKMNKTAKVKDS